MSKFEKLVFYSKNNPKELANYIESLQQAQLGDFKLTITPSVKILSPTKEAWFEVVKLSLQTTKGINHVWFNKDIAEGVTIANTSSAGTASVVSDTLNFVEGVATVIVKGDKKDWIGTETYTLTVKTMTVGGVSVAGGTSKGTFTNAEQNAPINVEAVNTTVAGNDGMIINVDDTMEYKLSTASNYTAITGVSVDTLDVGTYQVRYKAKFGFNASPIAEVVIE